MPTISNDEVEAEARAMLREQIDRSPWFREGLTAAERQECRWRLVEAEWLMPGPLSPISSLTCARHH